jgi:hypothetical protein
MARFVDAAGIAGAFFCLNAASREAPVVESAGCRGIGLAAVLSSAAQYFVGRAQRVRGGAMADREDRGGIAGVSVGGIIVIVGIVLMFVWSFLGGLIVVLVGLIAFGGFARGKWY